MAASVFHVAVALPQEWLVGYLHRFGWNVGLLGELQPVHVVATPTYTCMLL
jgi:hypothetical protein